MTMSKSAPAMSSPPSTTAITASLSMRAQGKVATQQATVERIGRQIVAQQATIAQARAQLMSAQAGTKRRARIRSPAGAGAARVCEPADARAVGDEPRSGGRGERSAQAGYRRGASQPRRAQGAATGSRPHPRRTEDCAGQSGARPVVRGRSARRSMAYSVTARCKPAISSSRAAASRAWCRSARSSSTPISRRRSWRACGPASRYGQRRRAAGHAIDGQVESLRRPPARFSRCCRPTTRPAISPKSCSGCRSASRFRRAWRGSSLLRPGMSVFVSVNTKAGTMPQPSGRHRPPAAERSGRCVIDLQGDTLMHPTATASVSHRRSRAFRMPARSPAAGDAHPAAPAVGLPGHGASACSWPSSTSRSCRPRSPRSRPASRHRRTKSPGYRTSYLIAEVIAIPLSGFLSRALGTRHPVRDLRRGLHPRQHHVRL